MNARPLLLAIVLTSLAYSSAWAQQQSSAPADQAVTQKVSQALAAAGIDPRTTSVHVTTTSDQVVYLTGYTSNKDQVPLAAKVAAKNAPHYKIVNQISDDLMNSFFSPTGGQPK